MAKELILASASVYRRKLLETLGLPFEVIPADIDETPLKGESPLKYVQRIARAKAEKISADNPQKTILAADTIAAINRKILGKPQNADEAAAMLAMMSGRRQKVITGICAIDENGDIHEKLSENTVKFIPLRQQDIKKYVADESNWRGYAGAYGLQREGTDAFIQWIHGSLSGIVGLPLVDTTNLLRKCGHDL